MSLTTTSRFTGYLVAGLRCGAERPGAEDTRLSDLFDFAYRRMEADGAGGTPTHKASMTGSPHVAVGRLPPLAPPPPPGPPAAGPPAGPARPEGPPAWLRGAGRWALALLLVVAGYAGTGGTLASTDEMAYRSQWRLAAGAARSTAYEGTGRTRVTGLTSGRGDIDGSSRPAFADGTVIVCTTAHEVCAVDAATGTSRWRVRPDPHPDSDGIETTPLIHGGTVYTGTGGDAVVALDLRTGRERWRFRTPRAVDSSPALLDGLLFFGCFDGGLYAVDATHGPA
ncbi:PQQ-binding-like beta-propeller repeat protein [Streptomyces sp. NPDC058734]|uniref:outer membrane protein assembly factor BamB family protein n=1 Tax=Streptomyces sp. NPDC058734 TaxID=3346615 RepID=UPI0036CD874C